LLARSVLDSDIKHHVSTHAHLYILVLQQLAQTLDLLLKLPLLSQQQVVLCL
jgi:hypothetical protein